MSRRRLASFEEPVKRARKRFEEKGGKGGFIDLLWKGMLIAEHKSLGKDLDSAYQQALDYFEGLAERDLPRYVIVSDFARIRLYDLDSKTQNEFPLKDLYKTHQALRFHRGLYDAADNSSRTRSTSRPPSAWESSMTALRSSGYEGHSP